MPLVGYRTLISAAVGFLVQLLALMGFEIGASDVEALVTSIVTLISFAASIYFHIQTMRRLRAAKGTIT